MRQLTKYEALTMMLKKGMAQLPLTDTEALSVKGYYPTFENLIGKTYQKKDVKFTYGGELYATNQDNFTFQAHWTPGAGMEALYRLIPDQYDGTQDDPIPYKGNMELVKGMYYTEDKKLYLCIRSSGIPVFDKLATLTTDKGGGYVVAQ